MKGKWICVLVMALPGLAQDIEDKDRGAILAMAGSYVVDFHFHETVGFELGYELRPPKDAAGLETVVVVEDSERRISLQHLLQTPRGIVKHWRQDWVYEPEYLWEFQLDRSWQKRLLSQEERAGKWAQRVFQVDDSPRYESLGRWQHLANLSQWTSQPTRRPLPRREYTTREDYNVMIAVNRHALTPTGWVHEQDNYKLREDEAGSHIIAREFGLNRYNHTDPAKLSEAVAWWQEKGPLWAEVRAVWDEIFTRQTRLELAAELEEKPLHRHLSRMTAEESLRADYQKGHMGQLAREIIARFQASPLAELTTN